MRNSNEYRANADGLASTEHSTASDRVDARKWQNADAGNDYARGK